MAVRRHKVAINERHRLLFSQLMLGLQRHFYCFFHSVGCRITFIGCGINCGLNLEGKALGVIIRLVLSFELRFRLGLADEVKRYGREEREARVIFYFRAEYLSPHGLGIV